MPTAFTKFDPRAFLEERESPGGPAKVANPAKGQENSLATLAGLAASRPETDGSAVAPEPQLIAPAQWFEGRVRGRGDEPGFESPCATRRGRVEEQDRVLLHFCCECGAWGAFGYAVNLRAGRLGRWFCAAHRPGGANVG
jgi:hypothetical protein